MKPSPAKTSLGEMEPAPPVSLTRQEEEAKRRFEKNYDAAMERLDAKAKEAGRLGVPLHYLVPVN